MSGHSKWSTIKHQKGAADAKRGVLFTKISRELAIAVKGGGSDPDMNFHLRLVLDKAKAANMPQDSISRATSEMFLRIRKAARSNESTLRLLMR